MAFSFNNAPTEAPFPLRQEATLSWSDSTATIDIWLVEIYRYSMTGVSSFISSAYVAPRNFSSNVASIDMQAWAPDQSYLLQDTIYAAVETAEVVAAPSITNFQETNFFVDSIKFEIYPVTGGVKGSLAGSHIYRPILTATNQPWDWSQDFSQYFPDDTLKKGWMTDRGYSLGTGVIYHMAEEDEATAHILQMANANYVYNGTDNLSDSDWTKVNYELFVGGALQDFLVLTRTAGSDWGSACPAVPIGPANIKNNANWQIGYDWDNGWDYYTVTVKDSGGVKKSQSITVYKDCRPIKHAPAQLYWLGSRGGAEYLRFDGRVKDVYDVGGRDVYTRSRYYDSSYSGSANSSYLSLLPEKYAVTSKGRRSLVLSEDFFTDAERELFKSAIKAQHMMVRFGGQWFPCRMKTTSYTHEQASSRLLPITCEVELTQDLLC